MKLLNSTSILGKPSITTKRFIGTPVYNSGNTATIEQYILTKHLQKEQTLNSTLILRNQNQIKIQLKSKISLDKLKPLLPWQSRNSPAIQELQTQQICPCLKQVCFLESPNFQPQKLVRLLHLLCQRENNPHLYYHQEPKPPAVLYNLHKPPLYPPQVSCWHNQH